MGFGQIGLLPCVQWVGSCGRNGSEGINGSWGDCAAPGWNGSVGWAAGATLRVVPSGDARNWDARAIAGAAVATIIAAIIAATANNRIMRLMLSATSSFARSRLINTFEAHPSDVEDLDKLLAVQELTYEHRTSF